MPTPLTASPLFANLLNLGFKIPDLSGEAELFPNSTCRILNGKHLAALLTQQAQELGKVHNPQPCLAVILVGEDPASQVYVKNKIKTFENAQFVSRSFFLPRDTTQNELLDTVQSLNEDPSVHGILVQLPLPKHIHADHVLNHIHPKKDVDGFLAHNIGCLALGHFSVPMACTPFGVMVLCAAYNIPLSGKRAVVVGRSNIVGKPMALMLLAADATVTMAHSKTEDLPTLCKTADILVAAAGKPTFIQGDWVKKGATVIDVGMHRKEGGGLCGDVHPDVCHVASALSPVPGGVGPMTIAMLLLNTALQGWAPGKH
jgi:methylenetetrahydrofolate dehydrogenase (NADP+)/methenyltetrahydrofolate cyclohydrolase